MIKKIPRDFSWRPWAIYEAAYFIVAFGLLALKVNVFLAILGGAVAGAVAFLVFTERRA